MRDYLSKVARLKLASVAAISMLLWQTGSRVEAQSGLEQLADFDYWQSLCELQVETENYADAQIACEQAIQLRPNESRLWTVHSEILLALAQYPEAIASAKRAFSLNEQNATALAHRCLAYTRLGQTETALTSCDQAIELASDQIIELTSDQASDQTSGQTTELEQSREEDSGEPPPALPPALIQALRYRGDTLTQIAQYEQALGVYEQLLLIDPTDSLTLALRCRTQVNLQQPQQAIETCQQALAGNGQWQSANPSIAYHAQADAYRQLNQPEAAIQAYDLALEADPHNADIWVAQGQLLQAQQQFTPALTSYKRAVELVPDSSLALLGQCTMMNRLAAYEMAESACQQAIQGDGQWREWGEAEAWNQRGQALSGQAKQEEALASLNRAVGMRPDYADAWNNQSVVYWQLGNLLQAEQDEQAALATYRQATASVEQAIALTASPTQVAAPALVTGTESSSTQPDPSDIRNLGQMHANVGRYHRTIAELYSNASLPDRAAVHLRSALTAYDQAIALVPEDAETWVNKSVVLWLIGDYVQANDAANQAIALEPTLVEAWQTQGAILVALGQFAQAKISYQEAIQRDEENAAAWAGLGVVSLQLAEPEAGLAAIQRALALDPAQPVALKTLALIEDAQM